jgi:hypothetical protein
MSAALLIAYDAGERQLDRTHSIRSARSGGASGQQASARD